MSAYVISDVEILDDELIKTYRVLAQDMARAKAWYQSVDYAEALNIRAEALTRRLIFVEGVS